MTEREPYATPGGVENAIKDAARKAAAADPALDGYKRIQLEYFNRFLSRVFSEGDGAFRRGQRQDVAARETWLAMITSPSS